MREEILFFDVFPRMVRAGRKTTVTIRPLYAHCAFQNGKTYQAALIPLEGTSGQMQWGNPIFTAVNPVDGMIRIELQFDQEQEYRLLVMSADGLVGEFKFYALDDDLFHLWPYKGDFHLHTSYSDGRESPAYVAAACRKIGLDFMAITDHRRYGPSLEAAQAFDELPIDLRIFPGEEVHPPENHVHILNFGGSFSVNALFLSEQYRREVAEIAAALEDLPEGMDRYPYASCVWCYDQIREAGGLGVFCHPYWINDHRCDVPGALTNLLLERQPFDALELIGGYHRSEIEANTLQVARYHEERARGKRIPIVGVSDTHGSETGELFGWYYTVAFARSDDLADLISAIKGCLSVAVEALPAETARAYGPFRLVRFAQFLMREIFPLHDMLCAEEGRLMLAHAAGDHAAAALLKPLQGRVKALYTKLWDRS